MHPPSSSLRYCFPSFGCSTRSALFVLHLPAPPNFFVFCQLFGSLSDLEATSGFVPTVLHQLIYLQLGASLLLPNSCYPFTIQLQTSPSSVQLQAPSNQLNPSSHSLARTNPTLAQSPPKAAFSLSGLQCSFLKATLNEFERGICAPSAEPQLPELREKKVLTLERCLQESFKHRIHIYTSKRSPCI